MRLLELPAGTIKSFPYALLNRAGGLIGRSFQLYLLLWILWTAYFVSGRVDNIPAMAGIRGLTYPGIPAFILPVLIGVLVPYLPVYLFWIYDRTAGDRKRRKKELEALESVKVDFSLPSRMELGMGSSVSFQISNPTKSIIENIWIRVVFPECMRSDSPQVSVGTLKPGASKSVSIAFIPLCAGKTDMGLVDFYFEMNGKEFRKEPFSMGAHEVSCSYLEISTDVPDIFRFGHASLIRINLQNSSQIPLSNPSVKCFFSKGIEAGSSHFTVDDIGPASYGSLSFDIVPKLAHEANLGYFNVRFYVNGNECRVGPVGLGKREIRSPELDVRLNIPDTFYEKVPVTIGITINNHSDETLRDLSFSSCFSSQLKCDSPSVSVSEIQPGSSRYVSMTVTPMTGGKVELGNLNVSFDVNGIICYKEPIFLGTYKVV